MIYSSKRIIILVVLIICVMTANSPEIIGDGLRGYQEEVEEFIYFEELERSFSIPESPRPTLYPTTPRPTRSPTPRPTPRRTTPLEGNHPGQHGWIFPKKAIRRVQSRRGGLATCRHNHLFVPIAFVLLFVATSLLFGRLLQKGHQLLCRFRP